MNLFPPVGLPSVKFHEPKYKIFIVVSGNVKQFNHFCNMRMREFDKYGIYQGEEYVYYGNLDSVRGFRIDGIIKTGTWYERNDIRWYYLFTMIKSGFPSDHVFEVNY